MKYLFWGLLINYFLLLPSLLAQEHHLRHFTTEDGLPTNSVYGCIQDRAGYIWVFTEKGIAKFDGYTFKNYSVADGLPTNDVWDLTEDHLGRIWIHGYADKAAYLWQDSIYTIPIEGTGLIGVNNTTDGRVALSTGNHLFFYLFDGKKLIKNTCIDLLAARDELGIKNKEHFRVSDSRNTRAFIPTNKGTLSRIDCLGKLGDSYKVDEDFSTINLSFQNSKMYYTRWSNKDFWITRDGIISITEKRDDIRPKMLKFNDLDFVENNKATQFWLQDSMLHLSIDQGLLIIDAQLRVQDFYDANFLSQKGISLNRKIKDREGNIWIATESRGLYLLTAQARNIQTYIPKSNAKVTAVTIDRQTVYFGTEDGAVYKLEGNNATLLITAQTASNPVLELAAINKNRLIIVRDQDTEVLNLRNGERKDFLDYLKITAKQRKKLLQQQMTFSAVKDFVYNEAQEQFVFAHFSGIYVFAKGKNKQYVANKLNKGRTIGVAIGAENCMWAAFDNGLGYITKEGQKIMLDTVKGLDRKVFSLLAKDDKVWVGTDGEGVLMYDGQQTYTIPSTRKDIVDDLFFTKDNILWVGTNKGLKEIQLTIEGKSSDLKRIYEVKDGLPGEEIHCVAANEQEILIGTNFGLTVIPRKKTHKREDKKEGLLKLNAVFVNGINTDICALETLKASQNEITFDFVNLAYHSIGQIHYKFFLEGADTDWQNTRNTSIRYPNLAPGYYTFFLKSYDLSEKEGQLSEPVRIFIAPPWWQTNLFYLFLIISTLGLVYILFNFLVNRAKRKNKEQFLIEKKFAELELQALQAQMNPHFIFNCLNGIQSFILNQESTKAVAYMGKFGHLMRLFLEASKNKFIPLDEEITLLTLYTELEQMRFSNTFQVKFVVDAQLDTEAIQIPTLLIQPFVENAILHGLMKLETTIKKKLTIHFYENETQQLVCEVIDNGIGRKKAAELQKAANSQFKSRATQIVNERLEVLHQMGSMDVRIEMEDVEPTQKLTGTLVRLMIGH